MIEMRGLSIAGLWAMLTAVGAGIVIFACSAKPPGPAEPATGSPAEPAYAAASLASLQGKPWRLLEFNPGEPPPSEPPITLEIEEGRFSGSAGCNQYFADVTSPSPGSLQVGPVGATKRACPGPIMGAELRYLEALGGAYRYALEKENLVLEWKRRDGQPGGRLLFAPAAADSGR